MFIALLSLSESLATKWVSLINELCITRPTVIHLNTVELNYYPFMISLYKCNGSCNAVDDLFTKICVPSKTKDVNVKEFNVTIRINKIKTLLKQISCDCKWKFNNTTFNSNQKWNNDTFLCECKKYCTYKEDYSWNLNPRICENSRHLKTIFYDSIIVCEPSQIMYQQMLQILYYGATNTMVTISPYLILVIGRVFFLFEIL